MWVQQEERGVKTLTVWVRWKRSEGREEKCGCSRKGGGVTNRVGAVKEERGQERTMLV